MSTFPSCSPVLQYEYCIVYGPAALRIQSHGTIRLPWERLASVLYMDPANPSVGPMSRSPLFTNNSLYPNNRPTLWTTRSSKHWAAYIRLGQSCLLIGLFVIPASLCYSTLDLSDGVASTCQGDCHFSTKFSVGVHSGLIVLGKLQSYYAKLVSLGMCLESASEEGRMRLYGYTFYW